MSDGLSIHRCGIDWVYCNGECWNCNYWATYTTTTTGTNVPQQPKVPSMPETAKKGKWIPVSERLPESGVRVLTCFRDIVEIQELSYISGEWENDGGDTQEFGAVSAWMPLPEPYKGDKDE